MPAQNAAFFQVPTLMARDAEDFGGGGFVTLQSNQIYLWSNDRFDATGGSSGDGLIQTLFSNMGDHTPRWIGNVIGPSAVSGMTTGTTSARLEFRALTGGSWGFIVGNSAEF